MIEIKRIYDNPVESDGYRILVDRLWPRGVSKERAKVDLWLKEISPTNGLRKWYSHDSGKWDEFQKKYRIELTDKFDSLDEIKALEKRQTNVTLLYASKDQELTHAVVLLQVLQEISEK